MSNQTSHDFERDLSLKDLLHGIDKQRLQTALDTLLGVPSALFNPKGECLLGLPEQAKDAVSQTLYGELEPIGRITAPAPQERLKAAADLITLLLRSNARYLMASELHLQTQQADFEELQRRHKALELSEQRYKALAETLEIRVKQQVKTIEHTQLKLYETEKLASVGRLAAGIAHEINNPIGFIRSNLTTASSYLASLKKIGDQLPSCRDIDALKAVWQQEDMDFIQQDMRDILDESVGGTARIAAIVKDLKSFSRVDDAERENADINLIIRQVCNVAAAELRGKAELHLDLGEIPMLHCHPGDLGQVFLSILMNAVDAITASPGIIQFHTAYQDNQITIELRDAGRGITEADMPHIFDPFFTTKEVGKGMGLGLSVSRNIIQAHHGSLTIVSRPNTGTRVTIALPVKPDS
ncbi:sensor histidine kinase [Methylomonas methanica]|uniref:histidine kinase n=1 Tax=Methylomonas methanica (strain DSM 25384 / MC09) TaxID=857087 RepID=F9ZVU9_METMM|nr:ATP-binding protein [Methylomonas methanica]AEF99577.1 histidine kinase [Methylomonas methanica MC09]